MRQETSGQAVWLGRETGHNFGDYWQSTGKMI
jgi:hypothetical protein